MRGRSVVFERRTKREHPVHDDDEMRTLMKKEWRPGHKTSRRRRRGHPVIRRPEEMASDPSSHALSPDPGDLNS